MKTKYFIDEPTPVVVTVEDLEDSSSFLQGDNLYTKLCRGTCFVVNNTPTLYDMVFCHTSKKIAQFSKTAIVTPVDVRVEIKSTYNK